jgi:GMP synthase (glutamine-hydrolysing)
VTIPTVPDGHEVIVILNYGSQYDQLILRRIRECNVYAVFMPHTTTAAEIHSLGANGVVLSGSPYSVYEDGSPQIDPAILELGIPILGICYGMQLIAHTYGGKVERGAAAEYGWAMLRLLDNAANCPLFDNVSKEGQVWMSHSDHVAKLPDDFVLLATSDTCSIVATQHKTKPIYAVQFHPEVAHSVEGTTVLRNFARKICMCRGDWTMGDYAEEAIQKIRKQVGNERVLCALSGGVDSAVVAALLAKAVGSKLSCVLVDHGLMRKGEVELIVNEFTKQYPMIDFRVINAADRFIDNLANVTDPSEKRKIIGSEFINVFSGEAAKVKGVKFLAQGTIYPDVIESGGTGKAPTHTIKLHHNVGALPKDMEFALVEPLRDLFKDEVRRLGLGVGLPPELIWRHPFPGPGLAVRCLEAVTRDKIKIVREADAIVIEELTTANLMREVSQAFAVLLPVKSVGVMGDTRTYEFTIAVRCVKTDDFMTADWSEIPYGVLHKISNRIINEVQGVNRVVYDISSKPPATIEWE